MTDRVFNLPQSESPKAWYNLAADLPVPLKPHMHPGTGKPLTPDDLKAIFPMALIAQEVCTDRWIDIPDEILDALHIWRPSPLVRATRLEKYLKTPARIYYKNESVSPAGSHKPNTAIAQAYYNKQAGITRLATETGAGQWGSALSLATNLFGLKCKVYMVRISFDQKPYRKSMIHTWGGEIVASPSPDTNAGRSVLEKFPDTPGSLGIAISEAVEDAATHDDTNYALGSVLNHVCMHQSIIGLEAKKQLALAGEKNPPDVVIGCAGGGSNFSGVAFPFLRDKINGAQDMRVIAVEPSACPTLTRGPYRYDFGDMAMTTPLLAMHTLGHGFVPPPVHAGGLRYHGMAPMVSHTQEIGLITSAAYQQNECFEASVAFARTEGIVPAPETAHAIKAVMDQAVRCREENREEVILFNFSGHGHFDMASYDKYFEGALDDYECPESAIEEALKDVPDLKVN